MKKKRLIGGAIVLLGMISLLILIAQKVLFVYVTPEHILKQITSDHPDAVVSVGVWEKGKETLYLYTKKGKKRFLPYRYQIGSVTKTFTGAMLAKQIAKEELALKDPIGEILELPDGCVNPTFQQLITYRSGLTDEWERALEQDSSAVFSREDMIELLASYTKEEEEDITYEYSNFGAAMVGTTVAQYLQPGAAYQTKMNQFIRQELGLKHTFVGGKGDFEHNYPWMDADEMLAAGAIVSTVPDLLEYGKLFLSEDPKYDFLDMTTMELASIDESYSLGFFWVIDPEMSMIWHNGEVSYEENEMPVGYQAFLGISKEREKVVVVLSNCIVYDTDDTALTDIVGYLLMGDENP